MSTQDTGDDQPDHGSPSVEAADLRQRAEAELLDGSPPHDTGLSMIAMARLIHELQVHQVELEMQNDELQRSRVEVEAVAAQAKEAARRYSELYDFAPIGYVGLSGDGTILQANLAAARLLGSERSRLRDRRFALFVANDDRATFDAYLTGVFNGESTPSCDIALEPTGQPTRLVCLTATASTDGQSAQIVLTDITERVRVQAERDALEAELRRAQKLEAIGTLAGGIAHDLNNVLAAIYGYTDLARYASDHIPAAVTALDGIMVASERAAALVRQIMTFGRSDEHPRATTSLSDVVDEVIDMVRTSAPQIAFDLASTAATTNVAIDPAQLHQVIMNVVVNGVHAIGAAAGRITLTTDTVTLAGQAADGQAADGQTAAGQDAVPSLKPGTYVRLEISDTGTGIDAAALERVFDPFYTTKSPGQGTGLGLWVVHRIVTGHDGSITVDSRPGQGSRFSVYLPAVMGGASTPRPPAPAHAPRGNGERILLVDDEEALCTLGRAVLEQLGYVCETYTRPAEALTAVQIRPDAYSVAIIDFSMPGMSGIELTEELRRTAPALPVIILTGNPGELVGINIDQLGVRQLLTKPVNVPQFAQAIRAAMDRPQLLG